MAENLARVLKKATLALLYIIIYFGLMYLLSFELALLQEDGENYSGVITILASLAAVGLYGVIFYLRDVKVNRYIRVKRVSVLDGVITFTMAIGFRMLTGAYFVWAENIAVLKESLDKAQESYNFNTMTSFSIITVVFSVCIVAPVFEEILFRGLVQRELMNIMPPFGAIAVQGVLFGIAHAVLAQSVFAAVYGVILGVIYYKTKNILVVMLAHMFFNLSSVLEVRNSDMLIQMVLTGLILTVASIFIFFYAYRKKQTPVEGEVSGGSNNG